ncbi:MAG: hypothetical protein JST00_18125 [Deltaproteobacteria bacterium]|nr:hypothetical protein [Deltaproteobacteria bacterium]
MYGYPQQPPPQKSSSNVLVIVLVVIVVLLVLGGGGCLLCIGLAATASDGESSSTPHATSSSGGLVHDALAVDLETRLRAQGVPATQVLCPPQHDDAFECELTVGADKAAVQVKKTAAGLAFDVPGVAFLDGAKLSSFFQTNLAAKVDANLRVPCFTGTLMKKVGTTFTCDVTRAGAPAGTVSVRVDDASGKVNMNLEANVNTPVKPVPTPTAKPGPRVVDFVCPPGKPPGGVVRAGCLCGDEILGTACGAPGNFTDVVETPRGCRFTCN